ncbi:MAG: DUF1045 domain-containing protein [Granulosicoccus sp.]
MSARYAIYFSPASQSNLASFGEACLGRSAKRVRDADASSTFSDNERWLALTEKPAHYGFHATLKAPFELREGFSEEQLIQSAKNFALNESAIELKTLAPRQLSHFLALTLDEQTQTLSAFAQRCVEDFDAFRQPLSEADRQRRLQQSLSERQIELLDRHGYPYVAEQFRFHMTLSGKLRDQDSDFVEWVSSTYHRLVENPPLLDRIALFTQADRQSPFVHLLDFPFPQSGETR